jgi:hypothetical protein
MIEIVSISLLSAAAARAIGDAAQNKLAPLTVLRNARREGELTRHSLAEMRVRDNPINAKVHCD